MFEERYHRYERRCTGILDTCYCWDFLSRFRVAVVDAHVYQMEMLCNAG